MKMSEENIVNGSYLVIDPPKRVAFTWGWEGGSVAPGSTTVEVALEPDGEGTLLRLRHYDLPDEEQRQLLKEGWDHHVDRLAVVAAGAILGSIRGWPVPAASRCTRGSNAALRSTPEARGEKRKGAVRREVQ